MNESKTLQFLVRERSNAKFISEVVEEMLASGVSYSLIVKSIDNTFDLSEQMRFTLGKSTDRSYDSVSKEIDRRLAEGVVGGWLTIKNISLHYGVSEERIKSLLSKFSLEVNRYVFLDENGTEERGYVANYKCLKLFEEKGLKASNPWWWWPKYNTLMRDAE